MKLNADIGLFTKPSVQKLSNAFPPVMWDAGTHDLADFVSTGRGQIAAFFQRIPVDQAKQESGCPQIAGAGGINGRAVSDRLNP